MWESNFLFLFPLGHRDERKQGFCGIKLCGQYQENLFPTEICRSFWDLSYFIPTNIKESLKYLFKRGQSKQNKISHILNIKDIKIKLSYL